MERKRRGRRLRAVGLGLALGLVATAVWPAPAAPEARERLADLLKAGPAEHKAALEAGGKLARFCVNCHDDRRAGEFAEVPKLAGQNPLYLLGQLDAFRSGRRSGAFMQGLARALSADEQARIALFYAAQPVTPALPDTGPRAAEGREHFIRNCQRCHCAAARGSEHFPRLAGQQPEYLRRNLLRFLGNPAERSYLPMTSAVTALGERNIEAVVAYLSSLK